MFPSMSCLCVWVSLYMVLSEDRQYLTNKARTFWPVHTKLKCCLRFKTWCWETTYN